MAQYINIFVILVNLEFQVTHYYYEGCDNIYIYIYIMLGSKDLGFYVFRTLMCIVGKPWSK